MAEFIEKCALLEKLKRTPRYFDVKADIEEMPTVTEAEIMAKEFGKETNVLTDGWIPCSERLPVQNGWYECWYMVSAIGEHKEYRPMTLYWEDNLWLYNPGRFIMPTKRSVIAWKTIEPYQKGEQHEVSVQKF